MSGFYVIVPVTGFKNWYNIPPTKKNIESVVRSFKRFCNATVTFYGDYEEETTEVADIRWRFEDVD